MRRLVFGLLLLLLAVFATGCGRIQPDASAHEADALYEDDAASDDAEIGLACPELDDDDDDAQPQPDTTLTEALVIVIRDPASFEQPRATLGPSHGHPPASERPPRS